LKAAVKCSGEEMNLAYYVELTRSFC